MKEPGVLAQVWLHPLLLVSHSLLSIYAFRDVLLINSYYFIKLLTAAWFVICCQAVTSITWTSIWLFHYKTDLFTRICSVTRKTTCWKIIWTASHYLHTYFLWLIYIYIQGHLCDCFSMEWNCTYMSHAHCIFSEGGCIFVK